MNAFMEKGAVLSKDRLYRYSLWRSWDEDKPKCVFIMLNPSTADENVDDRTIKKCIKFSMTWGFGALKVVNLFAFRSTQPEDMLVASDPVGDENDEAIMDAVEPAARIVAAWGTDGGHRGRDDEVLKLLGRKTVTCLDVTKAMFPKHPLYCRDDTMLKGYRKHEIYTL